MATIVEDIEKTGTRNPGIIFISSCFLNNSEAIIAWSLTYIAGGNWGQPQGSIGKLIMFFEEIHQCLGKKERKWGLDRL